MNEKKTYVGNGGSEKPKKKNTMKEWVCIWVDGESCNKKGDLAFNPALDNIGTWFHEPWF